MPVLIRPRYIAVKSFFLAILFHLCLFSLFTFTMSVRHAPPEPFFVFLGSILTKHDLRNPASSDTAYEISPIQFSVSDTAVTPTAIVKDLPLRQGEKPSFLDHPPTVPKKTYKDTRGLSKTDATTPAKGKKDEVTKPVPLKIQLKLYPDDQN